MDIDPKNAEEISTDKSPATSAEEQGSIEEPAASTRKKGRSDKFKRAGRANSKPRKLAGTKGKSGRPTRKDDKIVCRYCGSDDLAPSFIKRRDARCRACFKKRYGLGKQSKKSRRARAAKAVD
jgi:hypothetical protein